jgi:hypothetical protein
MRPTFLFHSLILMAIAILPLQSAAAPDATPPSAGSGGPSDRLDTVEVRRLYQDGDFERAIPIVERALKAGLVRTHRDSVFAFKHLGVMYAASETTRERGKYYMLQLLHIEPTARIMDMYASDMIYMIFRNMQEEFALAQAKLDRAGAHVSGNQAAARTEPRPARPKTAEPSREKSSRKAWYWIGAVSVVAGVGIATYILQQEPPSTVHTAQVD